MVMSTTLAPVHGAGTLLEAAGTYGQVVVGIAEADIGRDIPAIVRPPTVDDIWLLMYYSVQDAGSQHLHDSFELIVASVENPATPNVLTEIVVEGIQLGYGQASKVPNDSAVDFSIPFVDYYNFFRGSNMNAKMYYVALQINLQNLGM